MDSKKLRRVLILGAVIVFYIFTVPLMAAEFPTKPVTLIVPFASGGGTDLFQRVLADAAKKYLGQTITIENKPGGVGAVAASIVKATAKPDGYTILTMISGGMFMTPHLMKVTFDPIKDFDYIIKVGTYFSVLVVKADAPWKTFREFIDYSKANPNKVTYGTAGAWGLQHIFMEKLSADQGVKLTMVPMKGDAELIPAVLGGHLDAAVCSGGQIAQVQAGQLRQLATFNETRLKKFPQLPTVKEIMGKNYASRPSFSIAGPKGMDPKVVKILHDAFKKGMEDPAFLAKVDKISGLEPYYLNSKDCTEAAKQEFEERGQDAIKWGLKEKKEKAGSK